MTQTEHVSHTPGPWRAERRTYCWNIRGPELEGIGRTDEWGKGDERMRREMDANACLMAAAPDLLALAKKIASECSECGGTGMDSLGLLPCIDCEDITTVIAKAEGRK